WVQYPNRMLCGREQFAKGFDCQFRVPRKPKLVGRTPLFGTRPVCPQDSCSISCHYVSRTATNSLAWRRKRNLILFALPFSNRGDSNGSRSGNEMGGEVNSTQEDARGIMANQATAIMYNVERKHLWVMRE